MSTLFIGGCGRDSFVSEAHDVQVKDVGFIDIDNDDVIVSFKIENTVMDTQECYAVINITKDGTIMSSDQYYVGPIQGYTALSRKILVSMPQGRTVTTITPFCISPENSYSFGMDTTLLSRECDEMTDFKEKMLCVSARKAASFDIDVSQCFDSRPFDMKLFCLAYLADDKLLCNHAAENIQMRCIGLLESNGAYCGQIYPEQERDICYDDLSLNLQDKKFCESIVDSEIKSKCMGRDFSEPLDHGEY